MIDLHCHILPGIDDGAPDADASIEMALVASEAGVVTIVATPHVNNRYPTDPEVIPSAIGRLNVELARREVALAVLPGAEIAIEKLSGLDDAALRKLTMGGGNALLIETPYTDTVPFLEELLFDLQVRGFRPVLAHPERSRAFRDAPERLEPIVGRGIGACINSASLAGGFGESAKRVALDLIGRKLVHAVASDAHDAVHRPPELLAGIEAAESDMPGIMQHAQYFTREAPEAMLAGRPLPEPPDPPDPPPASGWRRLRRARR